MTEDPRDQRIRELEAEISKQAGIIEELQAKLAKFERLAGINSQNSSMAPSSDKPWQKKLRALKPSGSGRKRGGQKGHKGHKRELLETEACDAVHSVMPESCGHCATSLTGQPSAGLRRHQVTELPEIRPRVDEYQLHQVCCPQCGKQSEAALPEGVPQSSFGPRLVATVGLLTGSFRLSKRQAQALLQTTLGTEVALGSISRAERQLSAALDCAYAGAQAHVQQATNKHADETRWSVQSQKHWLWVGCTEQVAVFRIDASRSAVAAKALLATPSGILVTDRYKGYNYWPMAQRQVCARALETRVSQLGRVQQAQLLSAHRQRARALRQAPLSRLASRTGRHAHAPCV